jgi:hypothetical protein
MGKLQAGNYTLKNLIIFSEKNFLDISPIFSEINIFESIFTATISGYIEVIDANNIISGLNSLPILGNEGILIELEVPVHQYIDPNKKTDIKSLTEIKKNKIKYFGRIVDVRNRTMLNERSQTYEIHFISEESVLDRNIKVSKSYKNKTMNSIIENIYKDFGTTGTYEFEKTHEAPNVVIPNWSPLYTINWLASRSISYTYNTPGFFFFQTLYNDGPTEGDRARYTSSRYSEEVTSKFWFLSIDDMLAYDARKTIFFRPGNLPDGDDLQNNSEHSNALNYEVVNSFNTIENNTTGLFNNTLITHDITKKEWEKIPFNYDKEFENFYHLSENKIYSGVKNISDKRFDDPSYKESRIMLTSLGTAENPNRLQNISSSKLSRLSSLNYFRIKIVVTGDATLESGDVIKFDLPSPESSGENKFDKYYRGNFLITAIRHVINRSSYNMTLECSKESLESVVE